MKKLPKENIQENNPLVVFQNVTKEYDNGFKCLDDVTFTIGKGEFVFLVGRSGAGKSSLVKLLIREQIPSSGSIVFDGVDIATIPHKEIHTMRRRIGVVFQDFKILSSKNVFDNVAVALEVTDAPKSQIKEVVDNVLTLVGLLDKSQRFPAELSGGELQRVVIARALAHEPDLLVADEPTGNIDPVSSAQVVEVFEKINKMGVAVMMATHDDRVVDKLKKRVVRLDDGKVVSDVKEGKYVQSTK
ncbi:MAG: cell division ATP-binding protein FtsE [Patescibacteria group bacterium]